MTEDMMKKAVKRMYKEKPIKVKLNAPDTLETFQNVMSATGGGFFSESDGTLLVDKRQFEQLKKVFPRLKKVI